MKTFQLTANDIDLKKRSLIGLFKESYEINFPEKQENDNFFEYKLESLKVYLQQEKAVFIVATNEYEQLLGFVWFFKKEKEQTLHVNSIVVGESFRKQGVGKELWKDVDKYATENGMKEIELLVTYDNDNAVKFYKDRNFKVERLIMKKRL